MRLTSGCVVTDTSCRTHFSAVPFANIRPTLAVHGLRVLRMRCRVARPVSVAYERPELEAVIARNFTPALSGLVRRNNAVETLA